MKEQNTWCVGIDLGTTNSLIAYGMIDDNGKIKTIVQKVKRAIDNKGTKRNDVLLPSCIYYPDNSEDDPVVGDVAKEYFGIRPYRVAKSIKSQMGKPDVTGLQEGIVDKTPEEVSSRILRHLIADLERHLDEKIKDVVITVPASFDAAQRLATLRAAELAGVEVRNEDGSLDDVGVLLSEPEAVMYSIVNQIRNGEYGLDLDFSSEKKVLVFDIGGGTLDITMHSVRKDKENPEILDMDLIATNRFTPVAGDTFDEYTAEAMYQQYLKQYRTKTPAAAEVITDKKKDIFPSLCAIAEQLKKDVNDKYEMFVSKKKELPEDHEFDCGGITPISYSYEGYFTRREYEESVRPLLGWDYQYEDYKTIEDKEQTKDIIWPILDVLRKAAKKLQTEEVKPDAVILSGGMSRLYLVRERLEKFFGFHVHSVSDPDQAVAQGAVVYHYHQHSDSALMKRLHAKEHTEMKESLSPSVKDERLPEVFIRSGNTVQADAIYLGLRGGAKMLLADEGQELPYESPVFSNFFVEKGQNIVCIPIQKKGSHPGEFVNIASGNINFSKAPQQETPISIRFNISRSQIITLEAWMPEGNERGSVSFSFKEEKWGAKGGGGGKLRPPVGSKLVAYNEMETLCRLCASDASTNRIKQQKKDILGCSNPEDFAEPMLKKLELWQGSPRVCFQLLPVARKLANYWTEEEKKRLVSLSMELLYPALSGFAVQKSMWRSVYNEAILTIGAFGSRQAAERLYASKLQMESASADALIHAFAYHGVHAEWIYSQMRAGRVSSVRWIGLAVNRAQNVERTLLCSVFDELAVTLDRGYENQNLVIDAVISLGLLCDRRAESDVKADEMMCKQALTLIDEASRKYDWIAGLERASSTAQKLISGQLLNEAEEQYLLSYYEV